MDEVITTSRLGSESDQAKEKFQELYENFPNQNIWDQPQQYFITTS